MAEKAEERGSSKLIEERFGVKTFISDDELLALVAISERSGVELGNIIIRGIPAPTWLAGTVKATSEQAADLVLSLIKLRYRCDVFPYGIPVIDGVLVNFASSAEFGG
jgi:hypothetical protein